jgi:protein-L-isoaspartate(D-aspartate) O-methyltransferase
MIESQIRPNNVTNAALLTVMQKTPREIFVPPSRRSLAYMDGALQVEGARENQPARHLLAPMVFAKLAQLANVKPSDRVLDVGPATGYSTAILARLAKEVVALEIDAGLTAIAKDALAAERIANVKHATGPLKAGAPDEAPFDVIFVNGRLPDTPETLFSQLAEGGRLVAVIGNETAAKARVYTKFTDTIQGVTEFDAGGPALPGFEEALVFSF